MFQLDTHRGQDILEVGQSEEAAGTPGLPAANMKSNGGGKTEHKRRLLLASILRMEGDSDQQDSRGLEGVR